MKTFSTVSIEGSVHVKGDVTNLVLGDRVIIQSGSVLHLGGMEWCEYAGSLVIGSGSVISPNCVIYAVGPGGIKIGKRFDCGPGVGIFASRTDYRKGINSHVFERVEIGNDVTIFANAVISPGVEVGNGAVIAAGTAVTKNVPENAFVGGIPAKIIRENIKNNYDRNY